MNWRRDGSSPAIPRRSPLQSGPELSRPNFVAAPRRLNPERFTSFSPALDRRRGQRGGGPTLGKRRRMTFPPESGCIDPPLSALTTAEDRSALQQPKTLKH